MKLLIVGGGGYVGSVVSKYLSQFEELSITVIDDFIYEDQYSKIFESESKINLIKCRFEDFNFEKNFQFDAVIFFAGLVGDPITKKYPSLSISVNENSIFQFLTKLSSFYFDKFIFISTCSNYGLMPNDELATEESFLNPLSLYAKSKVNVEKFLLGNEIKNFSKTILRFSTAFGLSDRMRFDLTVNQFTFEAMVNKYIEIYDADTWRPYCHVLDFARAIKEVLIQDNSKVNREVFNVGLDENNSTKRMLAKIIGSLITDFKVDFRENGSDARNYKVSFKKINNVLNFRPKHTLIDGIKEIIEFIKLRTDNYEYKLKGNYNINKNFQKFY